MKNTYSFRELLEKYPITVPIFQRDYAHGRSENGFIRKAFIKRIKETLLNEKSLSMDFVYGNVEEERFFPIDGQQRLTLLWLIHWFLSYKTKKLETDSVWLKRFSYETRGSSTDFCKALCEAKMDEGEDESSLVDRIMNQPWFRSNWLQDPTIVSMLRTLGGSEKKDDKYDVEECIEGVFDCDYEKYYSRLFLQSLISMELLVIGSEHLPISDDLYVKMNARGKGLTDFENFKADLVESLHRITEKGTATEKERCQYFIKQIDQQWTDVFWNEAKESLGERFKGKIDEAFFAFFNRVVVNEICLNENMEPEEFDAGKEKDENKEEKKAFDRLYGTHVSDDSLIRYEGYEVYKRTLSLCNLERIDRVLVAYTKHWALLDEEYKKIRLDNYDENDKGTLSFLPRYDAKLKLIHISQKERIIFLATFLFLNRCGDEQFDERYRMWMRVVKNLVENGDIYRVTTMVTCMRLIDFLSRDMAESFENNIYKCLCHRNENELSRSQLDNQLREEIEKARKICEDVTWEARIIEAENWAFFNGAIRFLYRNIETKPAWECFERRFNKAKRLFEGNTVSVNTICLFLRLFDSVESINSLYLFTTIGFHARRNCWKREILLSEKETMMNKVNMLLDEGNDVEINEEYQSFIESKWIKQITEKYESDRYRCHWYGAWAIHKEYSQTEGIYISKERKEKCRKFKQYTDKGLISIIDESYNRFLDDYFWGVNIRFIYKNKEFKWSCSEGKEVITLVCIDPKSSYWDEQELIGLLDEIIGR